MTRVELKAFVDHIIAYSHAEVLPDWLHDDVEVDRMISAFLKRSTEKDLIRESGPRSGPRIGVVAAKDLGNDWRASSHLKT